MSKEKDTRTPYNYERIESNGNVFNFDGKGDKQKRFLKVYRFYGDITMRDKVLQDFCLANGYDKFIFILPLPN